MVGGGVGGGGGGVGGGWVHFSTVIGKLFDSHPKDQFCNFKIGRKAVTTKNETRLANLSVAECEYWQVVGTV